MADTSPLVYLALRFAVASVALFIAFRGWQVRPGPGLRQELAIGAVAGLLLFAGYVTQTIGLVYTSPTNSAFLTGLNAVFVPILGAMAYRLQPGPSEIVGVLMAFAGMTLMTLQGPIASVNRGDLLTIGCAVAYAAHIVWLGHFTSRVDTRNLALTQISTAALLLGAFFWVPEAPRLHLNLALALTVGFTGLVGTAFAFSLMTWAQKHISPTKAAILFTLEPVFAWVTSYLLAGERLSGRGQLGAALILAGVVVAELKPGRPAAHPSN